MFALHCDVIAAPLILRDLLTMHNSFLHARVILGGLSAGYLVVVEVVYECGEASGLVLQGQRQHGNMANEHGVKELCHLQVVAGT